jgi:membrane protein required for beta-lactamase induction
VTFLIIVCCLVAERLLIEHEDLREPFWFPAYRRWVEALRLPPSLRQGMGAVAWLWLPPLLLIGLLQWLLGGAWLGIPGALFSGLVLYFSLGPRELLTQSDMLISALERHDVKEIHDRAWELLGEDVPAEAPQLAETVVSTLVEQANRRSFAVLFWFLVLGPVGAAGYRLALLVRAQGDTPYDQASAADSERMVAVLDWIPARTTALAYALAGNFDRALRAWRAFPYAFPQDSGPLLVAVGRAALPKEEVDELPAAAERAAARRISSGASLVWRALLIWVALLLLVSVAGWS